MFTGGMPAKDHRNSRNEQAEVSLCSMEGDKGKGER